MSAPTEANNKRRNLNRWRESRLRRLSCIPWAERTARQQKRLSQLEAVLPTMTSGTGNDETKGQP